MCEFLAAMATDMLVESLVQNTKSGCDWRGVGGMAFGRVRIECKGQMTYFNSEVSHLGCVSRLCFCDQNT